MDAEAKALIDKKASKAPAGKAESALKAANSRPHPYLPNATSGQAVSNSLIVETPNQHEFFHFLFKAKSYSCAFEGTDDPFDLQL